MTTDGDADLPERRAFRKASRLRRVTAPVRRVADFLVIGAQKGGTTSLYEYLAAHPEVRAPARKEVHYFDASDRLAAGRQYRAFFPVAVPFSRTRTFDSTPSYLYMKECPARVRRALPEARMF